jgi:PKD repeat protein
MAIPRTSRTLVLIVASLMLVAVAASVFGGLSLLPGRAATPTANAVGSAAAGSSAGHELQVTQSAEVSLSHGAGPTQDHPADCSSVGAGSARCHLSARPASAGIPSWYDATNFTAAVSGDLYAGAMAWDPALGSGDLVFFGGCSFVGTCPENFTWVYDGFLWFNETGSIGTAPPPIDGQGMDWDPLLSGIVMTGGSDVNGAVTSGTWLFSGGTWQNITSTTGGLLASPPATFGALAWDPATQSIDYVGGCTNDTCGSVWDGIWTLGASGTWTSSIAFGFLYGESMAYDVTDQEMVVFGGFETPTTQLNETWTYAGGVWTNRTASSVGCFFICDLYPSGRGFASMTWDGQTGQIILFGGENTSGVSFGDTWTFSGNTWFFILTNSSFSPPAAYFNEMPPTSAGFAPVMMGGFGTGIGHTYVLDTPPTPHISVVAPNPADVGAPVSVTINGSAGAGSGPWVYLVGSFGNSQSASSDIYGVNDTTPWSYNVTGLTYPTTGTYEMVVTVVDFFYVSSIAYYNLTVVAGPLVTVHANPTTVEAGHAVAFSANVTLGVSPYTYSWSFGDTGTSSQAAPSHVYATPGNYTASVLVNDSGGGNATGNITIQVVPGVIAHAAANVTTTDVGLPVSFTGSASSGSGPYGPFDWNFGDGSKATTASATHTFTTAGTYHVTLNVTDSLGFVGTTSVTVVVNAALAGGSITANPSSPASGATVSFSVGASGGTSPLSYAWSFGDGGSSTTTSPTHAYGSSGTYTVTVVITDALGQKVTVHETVTVTSSSSSSSLSLTSGTGLYILVGIVVVILLVIAALALMRRGRGSAPASNAPPAGASGGPGPSGPVPPPGANP